MNEKSDAPCGYKMSTLAFQATTESVGIQLFEKKKKEVMAEVKWLERH